MHSESSLEPLLLTSIFRLLVLSELKTLSYTVGNNPSWSQWVGTVVAKLSLSDVRPPDIMLATGWFRMRSPTVKTHESPPAMHSMTQLKNTASVMVLGCVANDGRVVWSHLIPARLNINTVEDLMIQKRSWYRGFLAITMQTKWCSSRSSRVQNSARLLAREDADVRAEEHLTLLLFEHVSCDFWLWGVFRENTNAAIHGIIDPLKTSIRKPLKSNMPEVARVTCAAFSGQFNRIKEVYWGYIEWNVTSGTHECTYKKSARYIWIGGNMAWERTTLKSPDLSAHPCTRWQWLMNMSANFQVLQKMAELWHKTFQKVSFHVISGLYRHFPNAIFYRFLTDLTKKCFWVIFRVPCEYLSSKHLSQL